MATPSIPESRRPPADRTTAASDSGSTARVNQRLQAQEVQNLDRRVREFERQQARFEQERQRLADSHARSVKTTEEQLGRRQSQLDADQQRVRKLQTETEAQAQEAGERFRQAGVIEAKVSAGRRRGLMIFLLALPIAAGFIWYGWHSDQRQAQLERSLALLASDTSRLADELDDSSAARAEMIATMKSLQLEASGSSEALSRLQSQNTSLSAAAETLTGELRSEQVVHAATRDLLASNTADEAALGGRIADLRALLDDTQERLEATVKADGLRQSKNAAVLAAATGSAESFRTDLELARNLLTTARSETEAAKQEVAAQSKRLATANEALADSMNSLEIMGLRLAEREETAGTRRDTIALQDEAMSALQTRFDAMQSDLVTLRDGEVDRQALVAQQRAELQSRIAELEAELADATPSMTPEAEGEPATASQ